MLFGEIMYLCNIIRFIEFSLLPAKHKNAFLLIYLSFLMKIRQSKCEEFIKIEFIGCSYIYGVVSYKFG